MINEVVSNSVAVPGLDLEPGSVPQVSSESETTFDSQQFVSSMIEELTKGERGFRFVEHAKSLRENISSLSMEQLQALRDFVASSEVREKCNVDRLSPDSSGWNLIVNMLQVVINDRNAR